MRCEIAILPFAGTDKTLVEHLMRDLAALGIAAELLPEAEIPEHAYDPARRQFNGHLLLQRTREQTHTRRVLGVTDRDLYVPGLNFIFGLAESPGRAAIISVHRLAMGAVEQTIRKRAAKEAIHELGHTFDLAHCPDPACVMHFSNRLDDTDRKGTAYCAACRNKLRSSD